MSPALCAPARHIRSRRVFTSAHARRWLGRGAVLAFGLACAAASSAQGTAPESTPRWYDEETVRRGANLFAEHCAACHGARAEGAPDWRKRGADGKLPAPPLDGSGHGWHHPAAVLLQVILNGSPGGTGNMPAWKDKLSREDVATLIAWFQSLWPDEIYAAWYERELRSRQ